MNFTTRIPLVCSYIHDTISFFHILSNSPVTVKLPVDCNICSWKSVVKERKRPTGTVLQHSFTDSVIINSSPTTLSWSDDAQLKHRDKFTFTLEKQVCTVFKILLDIIL
jgi:hypothetical protein